MSMATADVTCPPGSKKWLSPGRPMPDTAYQPGVSYEKDTQMTNIDRVITESDMVMPSRSPGVPTSSPPPRLSRLMPSPQGNGAPSGTLDAARTPDLVDEFGKFAALAKFDDLPPAAVEAAKKSILDTIGVMLAASGLEPAVRPIIDLVTESGGRPESSVIAFGGHVPAVMAALANGALAHCLDFDDQTPWGQHASSSVVPAVLAVAERAGAVSGRELITAVAVGQDIFARLRCNIDWHKDWNLSTVLGVFAATAAAARVQGLDARHLTHALGIASLQSSGVMEMVCGTGSELRGVYAGFSAKGAVLATLLAAKGLPGVPALFEGRYGFFETYFPGGYNRANMVADLGADFRGSGTSYKLWPSVGTSHSHIQATIELMTRHGLAADDVEEIRVHTGDYHQLMCEPLAMRRAPSTLADAKFSLPFLVALAAVRGAVSISDFSPIGLQDPSVLAMAGRVVPVPDPDADWTLDLPVGRIDILTTDGRALSQTSTDVPGGPGNPLDWDQLTAKFALCASASVRPLSGDQVHRVAALTSGLEKIPDATALMRIVA